MFRHTVKAALPFQQSICRKIALHRNFEGEPGEQRTMFFFDPSGNSIEVKGFKDFAGVLAHS